MRVLILIGSTHRLQQGQSLVSSSLASSNSSCEHSRRHVLRASSIFTSRLANAPLEVVKPALERRQATRHRHKPLTAGNNDNIATRVSLSLQADCYAHPQNGISSSEHSFESKRVSQHLKRYQYLQYHFHLISLSAYKQRQSQLVSRSISLY